MGIRVEKCSKILEDNKAVIMNMQLPSITLKDKHNDVAYHKAREAVAAGFAVTGHVDGSENPSDILTKPVIPSDFYKHTGLVLFEILSIDDQSSHQGELQE